MSDPQLAAPTGAEFVYTRVFDAPRDQVWAAFSDAVQLARWWGPAGMAVRVAELDLRSGGVFHYVLTLPGGNAMWGKFRYLEIVAPERIESISCFSDPAGGVTRHPLSATWPLEMRNVLTLVEDSGRTVLTQRSLPHEASVEEQLSFEAGFAAMTGGFGSMYDQLAAFLSKCVAQ